MHCSSCTAPAVTHFTIFNSFKNIRLSISMNIRHSLLFVSFTVNSHFPMFQEDYRNFCLVDCKALFANSPHGLCV